MFLEHQIILIYYIRIISEGHWRLE